MKKSGYIVSKPLQYFNASNIEDDHPKVLFIVNGFNNAENFFNAVKNESKHWESVYFYKDYDEVFTYIKKNKPYYSKLFLDGDYSLSMLKNLINFKDLKIYVFEEGLGTYTDKIRYAINKNLYARVSPLRKLKTFLISEILRLLGQKNYHGGSSFTNGIYVYNIEKHTTNKPNFAKEIKTFKQPFLKHLSQFEEKTILSEDYSDIISAAFHKKVLLYLTSWSIDANIGQVLEGYKDYVKIIKPHPHISEEAINDIKHNFDFVVKGGNMIEFLIYDLCDAASQLNVIHHGSGALLYFENHEKIIEIIV